MQTESAGNESRYEKLISSAENEAAHTSCTDRILGGGLFSPFKEIIKLEIKEFVTECTEGECHGP